MMIYNHYCYFIYKIYAARPLSSCSGGKDDYWAPTTVCEMTCYNHPEITCYNVSIFIIL